MNSHWLPPHSGQPRKGCWTWVPTQLPPASAVFLDRSQRLPVTLIHFPFPVLWRGSRAFSVAFREMGGGGCPPLLFPGLCMAGSFSLLPSQGRPGCSAASSRGSLLPAEGPCWPYLEGGGSLKGCRGWWELDWVGWSGAGIGAGALQARSSKGAGESLSTAWTPAPHTKPAVLDGGGGGVGLGGPSW